MTATDARGAPVTTASRPASAPSRSAGTRREAQAVQRWLPAPHPVTRIELAGAQTDRLYFAQVREDPRLEIEALAPRNDETIAIVGSGGCTALSLLASGAGRVVAIDLNRTQNHLIEIKLAALRLLTTRAALEFLGGLPLAEPVREATYIALRPLLSAAACEYWDGRREAIRGGVIASGVSERFIGVVIRACSPAGRWKSSRSSIAPSGTRAAGGCCSGRCSTGPCSAAPTMTPSSVTSRTPASRATSTRSPSGR
jgi:hypothetical protein